jgi:hypothetical protein
VPLTYHNLLAIRESPLVKSYTSLEPPSSELRLHYAEEILRSSSEELTVAANITVAEFSALLIGPNLSIGYLGHVYTLACRGLLYRARRDKNRYDEFAQTLFRCSNLCLRLARDVAPQLTDAILWLAHENLQTLTLIEGDASRCRFCVFSRALR